MAPTTRSMNTHTTLSKSDAAHVDEELSQEIKSVMDHTKNFLCYLNPASVMLNKKFEKSFDETMKAPIPQPDSLKSLLFYFFDSPAECFSSSHMADKMYLITLLLRGAYLYKIDGIDPE